MNFKMKEELEELLEFHGPNLDTLEYKVDEDRYGNIYGTNPPSINQIVNTINNIILKTWNSAEYINISCINQYTSKLKI